MYRLGTPMARMTGWYPIGRANMYSRRAKVVVGTRGACRSSDSHPKGKRRKEKKKTKIRILFYFDDYGQPHAPVAVADINILTVDEDAAQL